MCSSLCAHDPVKTKPSYIHVIVFSYPVLITMVWFDDLDGGRQRRLIENDRVFYCHTVVFLIFDNYGVSTIKFLCLFSRRSGRAFSIDVIESVFMVVYLCHSASFIRPRMISASLAPYCDVDVKYLAISSSYALQNCCKFPFIRKVTLLLMVWRSFELQSLEKPTYCSCTMVSRNLHNNSVIIATHSQSSSVSYRFLIMNYYPIQIPVYIHCFMI